MYMKYFIVFLLAGIILSGCVNLANQNKSQEKGCSANIECKGKIDTSCPYSIPECLGGKCVDADQLMNIPRCLEWTIDKTECLTDSDCIPAGCSKQVCTTKEKASGLVTTCEYKQEYSCLKKTSCGCVQNKCTWADTPEYKACLANLPKEQEEFF